MSKNDNRDDVKNLVAEPHTDSSTSLGVVVEILLDDDAEVGQVGGCVDDHLLVWVDALVHRGEDVLEEVSPEDGVQQEVTVTMYVPTRVNADARTYQLRKGAFSWNSAMDMLWYWSSSLLLWDWGIVKLASLKSKLR